MKRHDRGRVGEHMRLFIIFPALLIQYFQELAFLAAGRDNFHSDPTFSLRYQAMVFGRTRQMNLGPSACIFGVALSLIVILLYGTYIYRQLHANGMYYFVRQRDISRWYRCITIKLFWNIFVYTLLQAWVPFVLSGLMGKAMPKAADAAMLAAVFISLLLFNYLFAMLVNVLAMKWGSVLSFLITYGLMVLSVYLADSELVGSYPFVYFYPTEVGMLSVIEGQGLAKLIISNRRWIISVLVMIAYIGAALLWGRKRILRMDIGLSDQEDQV